MRDTREREAQENMSSSSPSVDAVASVREDVAAVKGKDAMDWVAVARDKGMNGGGVSIMRGAGDVVAASRGDGPGVRRGEVEPRGKRRSVLPSMSGSWGGEVMGV